MAASRNRPDLRFLLPSPEHQDTLERRHLSIERRSRWKTLGRRWSIMWIASAQDAQKAAGAIRNADRNPRPPHRHRKRRDAMCHVLLGFVTSRALPWPLSFLRGASSHIRGIGREAESGGGGDNEVRHIGAPATHIAGPERWETCSRRNRSSHISCTNASDPNVVPRILTLRGLHTSGPSSSTPGEQTPCWFHTRVMPACRWIPALVESLSSSVSYPVRVRSGSEITHTRRPRMRRDAPLLLWCSWPPTEHRESPD